MGYSTKGLSMAVSCTEECELQSCSPEIELLAREGGGGGGGRGGDRDS